MTGPFGDGPGAQPATAPSCYRHPGRETNIRCVRCGRPICADCMVDAPVGFQCPECVRAGARGTAERRTVLGGRVTNDPAAVTKVLLALNAVVYVATLTVDTVFEKLALVSLATSPGGAIGVAAGEWYRLLSAPFLHLQVWHIALNLYALWLVGPPLEALLGRWRYAALYLVSAVAGSAASVLFLPPGVPSLGASGAVFGLLGATFVVGRRLDRDTSVATSMIVLSAVLGFVLPNIDWRGHLGGLIGGAMIGAVMAYAPRKGRTAASVAGCAVVLTVALVLAWVRTNQLR